MLLRILTLIVLASTFGGCAGTGWYKLAPVGASDFNTVEIEYYREDGEPKSRGFAHPAHVDVETLKGLLRELVYRDGSKTPVVVRREAVANLAAQIAEGLARCDATSRVRFQIQMPGRKLLFLRSATTTRGVAFVQPAGRLNLAFDAVDIYLSDEDDLWGNPTRRVVTTTDLVVPKGAEKHVEQGGKVRPMWLAFAVGDTSKPRAPMVPAAVAVVPASAPKAAAPASAPRAAPSVATPKPAAPAAAPKAAAPVVVPRAAPPGAPGPVGSLTADQILERLRYLEKLYREGTLSEAEYRRVRERLLAGK